VEKEKYVAGLWCSQVLAILSQYLDGELDRTMAARVDEHVKGCESCRKFGAEFAAVVTSLKANLADPEPVEPSVAQRLWRRLEGRL
jgi:predicted anti-sigma-YlaC factor YlaD